MSTFSYSIKETFQIDVPPSLTVEGFKPSGCPEVPTESPYHFRKEPLRDVLAFLSAPLGDALYLSGPTGSGKTSLIHQVAARLHWPLESVTCHGRLELMDLIGQFTLIQGETQFAHGPLARALKEGRILILNELDLMEPSELSGLNDCLEGDGLTIAQNGGERIQPHPGFRLIATANSAGQGDRTGLYQGVLRQNLALMDRFRLMEVDYPAPEFELELLKSKVPELPETHLGQMIRVANEIRQLFVGRDHQKGLLTLTLSTRGLIRWAHLTWAFRSAPRALEYALERALTFRADPDQKIAIHRIAADVLGDQWLSLTLPASSLRTH